MNFVFFSIIIPAFNRGYCIGNTLMSIEEQAFPNCEIIIVDDGSTDNTREVVEKFKATTSIPTVFLCSEKNSGPNISRNKGASVAKGNYFVFLDSDDVFFTINSLRVIYETILTSGYPSLLMFACIDNNGNKTAMLPLQNMMVDYKTYFRDKYKGEYLPVAKKECFMKVMYCEDVIGGEHITWRKMAKLNGGVFISRDIVRLYNVTNKDRLSTQSSRFYQRVYSIHKKDIEINLKDYLLHFRKQFILILGKLLYYRIVSFF